MRRLFAVLIASAVPIWATAQSTGYTLEVLAEPLEHPWSIAFLPDGDILVTERPGRLRVVAPDGLRPAPVEGLPEIFASGQGGLFDVLLAEDFADSGVLFVSYAYGNDDANHTRVVRARFDGRQLLEVTPIFTTQPPKSGDAHFGGRMAWMPDGTLLLGTGDGFFFREESQNLESHHGKIIRIRDDGSVPEDNPFLGTENVKPEIYSYGHRHVQAIVVDPEDGVIYAHEHGPRGGDEINVILPGRNYGWPVISYGKDYSRALITP
ncbi:MAG TPA: PQQ-dependent sugar dehydrogenase, partial [Woeseiaceae bacterium]